MRRAARIAVKPRRSSCSLTRASLGLRRTSRWATPPAADAREREGRQPSEHRAAESEHRSSQGAERETAGGGEHRPGEERGREQHPGDERGQRRGDTGPRDEVAKLGGRMGEHDGRGDDREQHEPEGAEEPGVASGEGSRTARGGCVLRGTRAQHVLRRHGHGRRDCRRGRSRRRRRRDADRSRLPGGAPRRLGGPARGRRRARRDRGQSESGPLPRLRRRSGDPARRASAREIAEAVREAGGVGFAAHPFSRGGHMLVPALARRIVLAHGWPALDDPRGCDGIELWSLTTDAAEGWRTPAEALRWLRDPELAIAAGPPPSTCADGTRSRRAGACPRSAGSTAISLASASAAACARRCHTARRSTSSVPTCSASVR